MMASSRISADLGRMPLSWVAADCTPMSPRQAHLLQMLEKYCIARHSAVEDSSSFLGLQQCRRYSSILSVTAGV